MNSLCVSYPKSGRTWLRAILADLGVELEFTHLDANPNKGHWGTHLDQLKPHRFPHGHKVVFLHRDPRDTVVSFFHQMNKRQRLSTFKKARYFVSGKIPPKTLDAFVRSPRWGIEKIIQFNLIQRKLNAHVLSYEALNGHPCETVAMLLTYLESDRDPKAIARAIENASFANMRRMEETNAIPAHLQGVLGATDSSDGNSFKVRKGRVCGYADEMHPETIAYCDGALRKADYFAKLNASN
jgi:hypothetical protein